MISSRASVNHKLKKLSYLQNETSKENTSSFRRRKDTLKVITTDIFRFPGNPTHETGTAHDLDLNLSQALSIKTSDSQQFKNQVYQREKRRIFEKI